MKCNCFTVCNLIGVLLSLGLFHMYIKNNESFTGFDSTSSQCISDTPETSGSPSSTRPPASNGVSVVMSVDMKTTGTKSPHSGLLPPCSPYRSDHGPVVLVSQPETFMANQWNEFVIAPLHCSTTPRSPKMFSNVTTTSIPEPTSPRTPPVPCCGGGDYIRVEFVPDRRKSTLYVEIRDNTDGTYTCKVFPVHGDGMKHKLSVFTSPTVYAGISLFMPPWRTNLKAKNAFQVLAEGIPVKGESASFVTTNGGGDTDEGVMRLPYCGGNALGLPGVWLSANKTIHYVIPQFECRLKPVWQGEEIRKCLHLKNTLFNGDSTLVEQVTAIQAKLYDNFAWHRMAFEPNFRQFDAVHTNANEPITVDDKPGFVFRTRLSVFWNGAYWVDGNFFGLKSYANKKYVDMLRNHSSRCELMEPKHRTNRRECKTKLWCIVKPMMLISVLLNETRSPKTCGTDIPPTPNVVIFGSGMHDFRWMNGSTTNLPEYRKLLNDTITMWKSFVPRSTEIVLRTAPVPSAEYRHEHVLTDMMNRVMKEVAKEQNVSLIDVFSLVYPYAECGHCTDGHHWLQNTRVKRREKAHKRALINTPVGEAYMSMIFTQLCGAK